MTASAALVESDPEPPGEHQATAVKRLRFVDWTRGFAVMAMVLWHTADAWLLPAIKVGPRFAFLRFIGGLAAPGFLVLAGSGAALAAKPTGQDAPRDLATMLRRPLQIVLLGYLLRLQGWLIDGGAILRWAHSPIWLPLLLGYACLLATTLPALTARAAAARWLMAGFVLSGIGLLQADSLAPARFLRLTQVDILQAIGACLALLAIGQRCFGLLTRPGWLLAIAIGVALASRPIWNLLPGPLPFPLATYLGQGQPPPGLPALSRFPLFPWLAYACTGAALGHFLLRAQRESGTLGAERVVTLFALVGAFLSLNTSEAHGYIRALFEWAPWTIPPLRLAFRAGLIMVLLGFGWIWTEQGRGGLLIEYGRASLRIYWAHMLFAYGILGTLWHKQLHYSAWLLLATPLLLLMWSFARWNLRAPRRSAPSLAEIVLEQQAK